MNEKPKQLSRDFVERSVRKIFDEVESQKRWGAVTIMFQDGMFKTIKEEKTISTWSISKTE
jgi:hypothetical protein